MQLNVSQFGVSTTTDPIKKKYEKIPEHDKITLKQISSNKNMFHTFIDMNPNFGFAKEEYEQVFLLVQGKYIGSHQSALAIEKIDELILSNTKPDIIKHTNIPWPTTKKEPPPKPVQDKRRRAVCSYLEAPAKVTQHVIVNYNMQYDTFIKNLNKLHKEMNTEYVQHIYNKEPLSEYLLNKIPKDSNHSKKFDDTLIDIHESKAILLSLLAEVNRYIGKMKEYMIHTLQIAYVKHGNIHPKSKSIKINNETKLTPISPTIWKDCNDILCKASKLTTEIQRLLDQMNNLDISNHKYLKRKTVKQRVSERKATKKRKLIAKKASKKTSKKEKKKPKTKTPSSNAKKNSKNTKTKKKAKEKGLRTIHSFWNNNSNINKNNNNNNSNKRKERDEIQTVLPANKKRKLNTCIVDKEQEEKAELESDENVLFGKLTPGWRETN
eukprot:226197_1